MEFIWFDVYSCHFFIADFDSLEVHFFVESSVDFKSCFGRCGGDEIDDGCVIVEWFFFPVHANKAEKSMLDFVPFACAWRIMCNRDSETGLTITIAHYPPGTSKWNKIEHRLFSFISMNWKEKPLYNHATIINLIAATTTKTGLKVYARLDKKMYLKGIKVSDEEMARINIKPNEFHGEWNYTIKPN